MNKNKTLLHLTKTISFSIEVDTSDPFKVDELLNNPEFVEDAERAAQIHLQEYEDDFEAASWNITVEEHDWEKPDYYSDVFTIVDEPYEVFYEDWN